VFILLLIKPPAATGQSHSSAKFACPDADPRTDKISNGQALLAVTELGALWSRGAANPSERLCWIKIRLHCAASLRRRSKAAPQHASVRDRRISSGEGFTVAAEFIN
jgi:hypothetical protein